MKITEEFLEKSVFPKNFIDLADLFEEDETLFKEIISLLPEEIQKLSYSTTKTIASLKANKFQEARINFIASHQFDTGGMNEEVKQNYRNIKSLITGIILSSSIIKKHEIEDYQAKWSFYAIDDRLKNSKDMHHHKIYTEFKQVHTMHELINFNVYFQNYILDLMADFADDFLTRLKYTYEYLENEFPENEVLNALKNIHLDLSEKIIKAKH